MGNINKFGIMKYSSVLLILLFYMVPSFSYSSEHIVYKQKKVEGKNNLTIEYGLSGSWHTECHRDQPYGKLTYQSCTLRFTDGSKWRSGIHKASGPSPVISISHIIGRIPKVRVSMGYLFARDTEATITVGGKVIKKVIKNNGSNQGWWGNEAIQIIHLFILENKAKYNYVANNGRQSGIVRLNGFTKAWDYAVNFTGLK